MIRTIFMAVSIMSALATAAHEMPKVEMPKEFDALKALVGTWEGTSQSPGAPDEKVSAVYELTSGGTALVEKLMPGTPHEMVSVYHKEGKSLAMTHYCALGNQPHMVMKKSNPGSMAFEMTRAAGVSSMKEPHMHALTLTMGDSDSLKQEWTHFEGGKKKGTATFTLTRKKS